MGAALFEIANSLFVLLSFFIGVLFENAYSYFSLGLSFEVIYSSFRFFSYCCVSLYSVHLQFSVRSEIQMFTAFSSLFLRSKCR